MYSDGIYSEYDLKAAEILDDFLPGELFDAHMHIYEKSFAPNMCAGGCFAMRNSVTPADYLEDMRPLFKDRKVHLNMLATPDAAMQEAGSKERMKSTAYLGGVLEEFPGNVGEVMTGPLDTTEDLEKQLVHPRVVGFKCYHSLAIQKPTFQAGIEEYLPESAWEVAEKHHLVITLHMVRDLSLADPGNLAYIKTMAKKYPGAVLILAHAARSFAAWTGLETVQEIAGYDNIWFDFSAICESPAMFMIMKKAGVSKCMWGSDYPVCRIAGKAISIADSFYWIGGKDLETFAGPTEFHSWLIATENLMAVRQACLMLDLKPREIEDLFCNNAKRLFRL